MTAGRVRVFRQDRGFGFIAPDDGSYDVFVEAADIDQGTSPALANGEPVEYSPAVGQDGQLHAVAVHALRKSE
ncbi:MAG TPA: cold shock domain-containing protein [Acidimicrobiales bacterium]|nr:cold shock domain-containing protein [Acidimicrobiales bacterium]